MHLSKKFIIAIILLVLISTLIVVSIYYYIIPMNKFGCIVSGGKWLTKEEIGKRNRKKPVGEGLMGIWTGIPTSNKCECKSGLSILEGSINKCK